MSSTDYTPRIDRNAINNMPLSQDIADHIVNDLLDAANSAKEKAAAEKDAEYEVMRYPDFTLPPLTRDRIGLTKRLQRKWAANLIRNSIDACDDALRGLVWLAAHDRQIGIESLERGIAYRSINVWEQYNDNMWNPIKVTIDTLLNKDLPALRENRRVESGLYARFYAGMVWESCASPFVNDILDVYRRVRFDVAAELEC